MGWGALVVVFGISILLYSIPATVLIETLIIRQVFNLPFWHSLLDSMFMNIASGILGFIAVGYLTPSIFSGIGYYDATKLAIIISFIRLMGITCLLSIMVEGIALRWMEKSSPQRKAWITSIYGNVLSYLGLFVISILYIYK